MNLYDFKACTIGIEINLNNIATHFGVNKKFKWGDFLVLDTKLLTGIILHPEDKMVHIYHFGSIVGINLTLHEIKDIIEYIKRLDTNLKNNPPFNYTEDFRIEIKDVSEFELYHNSIAVEKLQEYQVNIVSTILAKSVALKKIEVDIDKLLDEIENIIEFLDKGHLNLSDENLAKMSGNILRFKYNTISYLMLLDKPDIAWQNKSAEDFYVSLSELFELHDRYETIKNKTEVLLDITEVFSSLTHAKRGTKLEWMVIILILAELILSLLGKFI